MKTAGHAVAADSVRVPGEIERGLANAGRGPSSGTNTNNLEAIETVFGGVRFDKLVGVCLE